MSVTLGVLAMVLGAGAPPEASGEVPPPTWTLGAQGRFLGSWSAASGAEFAGALAFTARAELGALLLSGEAGWQAPTLSCGAPVLCVGTPFLHLGAAGLLWRAQPQTLALGGGLESRLYLGAGAAGLAVSVDASLLLARRATTRWWVDLRATQHVLPVPFSGGEGGTSHVATYPTELSLGLGLGW